jgi:hypothetical protein
VFAACVEWVCLPVHPDSDDNGSPADAGNAETLRHRDPEVPEADALDQAREVVPGERLTEVSRSIDAPEADAIEQAIEEPVDLDDEPPPPAERDRP